VIRLSNSSSNLLTSTTIWILWMIEPSFSAMNATFLLPRLVRTQPLAVTSLPAGVDCNSSAILVLPPCDIGLRF